MQQVAVHLRLDEDEVDKDYDKVVLNILVAKLTAVAAHSQSDVMAAGLVTGTRVLGPERLDRVLTLDADGHRVELPCGLREAGKRLKLSD